MHNFSFEAFNVNIVYISCSLHTSSVESVSVGDVIVSQLVVTSGLEEVALEVDVHNDELS